MENESVKARISAFEHIAHPVHYAVRTPKHAPATPRRAATLPPPALPPRPTDPALTSKSPFPARQPLNPKSPPLNTLSPPRITPKKVQPPLPPRPTVQPPSIQRYSPVPSPTTRFSTPPPIPPRSQHTPSSSMTSISLLSDPGNSPKTSQYESLWNSLDLVRRATRSDNGNIRFCHDPGASNLLSKQAAFHIWAKSGLSKSELDALWRDNCRNSKTVSKSEFVAIMEAIHVQRKSRST